MPLVNAWFLAGAPVDLWILAGAGAPVEHWSKHISEIRAFWVIIQRCRFCGHRSLVLGRIISEPDSLFPIDLFAFGAKRHGTGKNRLSFNLWTYRNALRSLCEERSSRLFSDRAMNGYFFFHEDLGGISIIIHIINKCRYLSSYSLSLYMSFSIYAFFFGFLASLN